MNYSVIQIFNLINNDKYIYATNAKLPIHFIQHKEILSKLQNSKYSIEVLFKNLNKTQAKNKLTELQTLNLVNTFIYRLDKKFLARDKNGLLFSVYKDDPRVLNGELIHNSRGYVMSKDKEGNICRITKEEFIASNGKYVGMEKGRVTVKNKNGEICKVSVNNSSYLNGTFQHISKNTLVVKDINGNNFRVSIDDPRLKTKELLPVNKGKKLKQNYNTSRYINIAEKYSRKFKYDKLIEPRKENYLIQNFCEHGDLLIKKRVFKNLYKRNIVYLACEQCHHKFILDENDIKIKRLELKEISLNEKNYRIYSEKYCKLNYPDIYLIINHLYSNIPWMEKCFLFSNSLSETPICQLDDCTNKTTFAQASKHYNMYCEKHKYTFNTSKAERELFLFVKKLHENTFQTNRDVLNGKELDIYIPDKNLAIEYNGLYNHSELFKEKNYHFNKWNDCIKKDIKLLTIWESDWDFKQEIVKSIIKNQLGLTENKIYARNTIIKIVNYKDAKEFLNNNHLQGVCSASIKYGLYHQNELVSLMTFGKKRMILKSKSLKERQYELLRFCNKLNTSVIGGASKLFNYFIEQHKPEIIISYANCDISNGQLYEILNFINKGHTGAGYKWIKGNKTYHRSNFMKHKLVKEGADPNKTEEEIMREKGYHKIWNCGNIKYEYEKPN